MVVETIRIHLKKGLQARAAALFVREASRFQAEVWIASEGKKVNAKSIIGLMSLAIHCGQEVSLGVEGSDEQEAMDRLKAILALEEMAAH